MDLFNLFNIVQKVIQSIQLKLYVPRCERKIFQY